MDLPSAVGIEGDRASRPPDKIRRMRADHDCGFLSSHATSPLWIVCALGSLLWCALNYAFARHLHRRGAIGVKEFNGFQTPCLSLLALGLAPADRLPVR